MKISKLRRALAVLLSAAMLIMCMPFTGITAAAVTDTTSCMYITVDGTVNTASEVDPDAEWSSGTLSDALTAANAMHNGKTVYIKMLSDVTGDNYGQTISFSAYNGNTVFDLNGHSVDGNNAYRCVHAKSKGTLTISSSASSRGTITNGYSESDGAAGIYHEYGTLTLSNVNVTNNTLKGRYGAGVTSLSSSTSTTLSNVKISGNQSLYSSDSFAGGFMPYKPFTLKNQVEITGNSNSFSNDRNFYPVLVVGDVSKSSISGLTAGSEIKIWNNSGKVTISGDGGNNPDIYNYFTLTNDNYWLAPTSTGGLQATNSVYAVIFDMQGKADNVVNTVSSGAKATKPSDPTASDGSTFGGWYKDKECTQAFDFSTAINANTTLYAKWATVYPDTVQLLEGVTLTPTDDTCTQYTISGLPSGDYEYYYYLYYDRTARVIYNQLYEDYSIYIGKSTDEVTVDVNDMKAVKNGDTITLAMDVSICPPIGMVRLYQVKPGSNNTARNLCAYEGYFIGPQSDTVDIGKKIEALDGVKLTPNASKTKYTVELPEIEEGYMYAYGLETLSINEELPEEQINEATNFVNGMVSDIVGKSVGSHSWAPDIFNEIKSGDTIDVSGYSFIFIDKFKKPASETDYNALDLDGSYKSYAYYGNFIGTYTATDSISEVNFSGADKITLVDGKALPTLDEIKKKLTVTGKYTNGTSFDGEITYVVWVDVNKGELVNDGAVVDIEKKYMLQLRFVPKGADKYKITIDTPISGGFKLLEVFDDGIGVGYKESYTPKDAEPDEPIEEGDIIIDNSDNYSGAGVANAEEAKSVIPLRDDEKAAIENGENLYIILDVKDGTDTVPTTDRTAVNTIANENGLTVGMMLDIELFKRIGENGSDVRITETNGMLTVEFTMPAELLSTDGTQTRTYKIIRIHNGVPTILDCDFDPATGKASFKTNKFSTYAIAYVDVPTAQPQTPVTKYPIDLGTDGRVHSDKNSAAAGDKITITVDPGYIAHVYSGSTEIARITGAGSFIMPANGVRIVLECELEQYMLTKARSYVYSYDSGMNYITVNATKNQKNTVTVNLGKDYAGKSFVIYQGKKSTKVKVTEGVLDGNGKFTFEVDYGKNYTLVVED